jgi:hypothetical protein
MQVAMELKTGSAAGRKVHLVSNQVVCVGKSHWADFVVADDAQLADRHFVLETDAKGCRVRIVNREHAIMLNGKPIELSAVRDGDCIRAGGSEFVLAVHGDSPGAGETPVIAASRKPPPAKAQNGPVHYESEKCDSGVMRYVGKCGELAPAELAKRLASIEPLHAVVDFRRLETSPPTAPAEPKYLFDWMGDAAPQSSPVLLSETDTDLPPLIERGWRKNGVVCLFSSAENETLLAHWREKVRPDQGRVLGLCWPSILCQLVERSQGDFVQAFIKPFRALLVEDSASPDNWLIYAWEPLDASLEQLRLERMEKEE